MADPEKSSMNTRETLKTKALLGILLLISLLATLLPLYWMISGSFSLPAPSSPAALGSADPGFSLQNYRILWARSDMLGAFLNSLIFSLGFTVMAVVINSLAAYAFARLSFPGRDRIFVFLILTMMIPSQVTLIPVFLILRHLGALNSFSGLILPGCAHVFGILMVRQAILDLPEELFEAARIDGCSEWHIYQRIVVPLCWPVLTALALLSFVTSWNEFLLPLVVMQDSGGYTLPLALTALGSQNYGDWGVIMAGACLAAIPIIVLFLVTQRQYLRSITAGALK